MSRRARIVLGLILLAIPFLVVGGYLHRDIDAGTATYLATNGLALLGLWSFLLASLSGEKPGTSLGGLLQGAARDASRAVRTWPSEGIDQPWSVGEAIGVAMGTFRRRSASLVGGYLPFVLAPAVVIVATLFAVWRIAPMLSAPLWKAAPFLAPADPAEAAIMASRPVPPTVFALGVGGLLLAALAAAVGNARLYEASLSAVRDERVAPGSFRRALRRSLHVFLTDAVFTGLLLTPVSLLGALAQPAAAPFVMFFVVTIVLVALGCVALAMRLVLAPFFVVDEDASAFTALKKSWSATRDDWLGLMFLGLALAPVRLLGSASDVFRAVSTPFGTLGFAFAYARSTGRNAIPWLPTGFASLSVRRYLRVTFLVLIAIFAGLVVWVQSLPTMRGSAWSLRDTIIRASAILTGVGVILVLLALVLPYALDRLEGRRFIPFVAARHVRSQKSGFLTVISVLSICGVAISSCALSSVVSVMGGFSQDLKRKILGNNAHIVVDVTAGTPFADYRATLERVRAVPGVVGATAVFHGEVMASSSSNIAGVMVSGIDPESITKVIELPNNLEVGKLDYLAHPEKLKDLPPNEPIGIGPGGEQYFKQTELPPLPDDIDPSVRSVVVPDKPDRPGIILGRELAKTLHVYVGDELTLVSPLGDLGPMGILPRTKKFRVAGIFYSGMYEYDATYVYTMTDVAQDYFQAGDEVSAIEIKVDDAERAELVAPAVEAAVARPELRVRDWREINKNLFSALKLERFATFVILSIAIMVASFCIVCTLLLMVTEKGKEIAILKAVGASDGAILRIFMIEGVIIGAIGTMFGVASGLAACTGLKWFGLRLDPEVYYIDRLPISVNGWDFLTVALAALTICTLSTVYPAFAASRLRPVDGLRYE